MITSVGIIGQGFVGNAIKSTLSTCVDIQTYDKFKPELSNSTIKDITRTCQVIFICVPTPMNDDGTANTDIVEDVVSQISQVKHDYNDFIVVIKSTIPPGTTQYLTDKFELKCVFNPEFLNAATATEDFINQTYLILGGNQNHCMIIENLFRKCMPNIRDYYITDALTAECIKYVKNCFFATKVSFANEMYQIMNKIGVDYASMIEILKSDERVGWEHWKVPGPSKTPDGEVAFGFGGMCLPKDLSAFRTLAKAYGIDTKVLDAVWEKNLEVRPQRDWEKVPGVKITNG